MLQVSHELRQVNFTFTGPSLARVIPQKSPVQRAFLAADLHRGELIRPTITQLAACCHGADIEIIRKALCRDGNGRALSPISAALDLLSGDM